MEPPVFLVVSPAFECLRTRAGRCICSLAILEHYFMFVKHKNAFKNAFR